MRILVCAVVCVSAIAAATVPAFAQTVEGGVRIGVTSNTIAVSGLPGFEPQADMGLLGGGWISFGRERVRVQTELNFATMRFSLASPVGTIGVSSRAVDVPVLVVGRWRSASRTRPFAFGGPYFRFLSGVTQSLNSVETDISDQIKNTDAGAVVGGGVEIGAGKGAVVLDARFTFGLRDVSEAAETTFKPRVFMASFGYRF